MNPVMQESSYARRVAGGNACDYQGPTGERAKAAAASTLPSPRPRRSASSSMLNSDSLATPRPRITTADWAASSKPNTSRSSLKLAAYFTLGWLRRSGRGTSVPPRAFPGPRATNRRSREPMCAAGPAMVVMSRG